MENINHFPAIDGVEPTIHYAKRKPIVVLKQVGNLLYTSGHGPEDQITGKPIYAGRIGSDLTPEEGYAAARECGIILIGALKDYLGSLDRVKNIVKATALVNVDGDFCDINGVMDGFSDLMVEVFAERGYHARTVMGTHNMPNGNIPVEIEMIVEI
ncbi:MAG: RidA family protein [Eubacteriales bacterium]|nr:RidA family protein [Eubacteriales bacterium]